MSLQYTPARTITIPDTYTDESGIEYRVEPDVDAESPTDWGWDVDVHYVRTSYYSTHENPDDRFDDAWEHFANAFWTGDAAREVMRRYVRIFYPGTKVLFRTLSDYSQNWADVMFVTDSAEAGLLEGFADVYAQWYRGDVYFVSTDDDAMGGIYADSEEDAVRQFIAER